MDNSNVQARLILVMVAQQKKSVLMPQPIRMENSVQLIHFLLLMAVQSFVTISKEKSCAHPWKTLTVARNHPSVWQEPWIQTDNTVLHTLSVHPTANLTRLPAPIQLILEVVKKLHFVEPKEMIRMENSV